TDFALLNPNTHTCPTFRSQADAELTRKIYRRAGVFIDEGKGEAGNPWGVRFARLFDMASDSGLFRTLRQLEAAGGIREGGDWRLPDGRRFVPLYEAKMAHHFDHRWATYEEDGQESRGCTLAEKGDAAFRPRPRYWVPQEEVESRLAAKGWQRGWLLGWRDICRSTDERTVIAGVVPRVGVGDKFLLAMPRQEATRWPALMANFCALPLDYLARQKVGGTSLKYFTMKQLPILPPTAYTPADLAFIVPRVLELTCTAHDLAPFAADLGHPGPPFPWDPERRAVLRSELDACFARLYGLSRDELRYILDPADVLGPDYPSETFRVLKNREMREYGEYRTARLVLAAYDRLAGPASSFSL
ncbi:MAG: SAM-dependent DNA methyltransferase, partial [Thermodesulfobacteriota bacterium]